MSVAAYEGDGGHRDHGAGGLGGAGAVLLLTATEMSVEFMRTNRYSESQKCMFVVCRSRFVDDYTVDIYRR